MKKKRNRSIKAMLMVPIAILGALTIMTNIMAMINIRNVNGAAQVITDEYMQRIALLNTMQEEVKDIHNLGLSHIIATSFDSMIDIVNSIKEKEEALESCIAEYKQYVENENQEIYNELWSNLASFEYTLANLTAYSADNKTDLAYAYANEHVAAYANAIQESITTLSDALTQAADDERQELADVYRMSVIWNNCIIVISIITIIGIINGIFKKIIAPMTKVEQELSQIISDIDNQKGDLTTRVSVGAIMEIAAMGNGINAFIEKLQNILHMVVANSQKLDDVVNQVQQSVRNSDDSVAELSAVTEELSASMEEVAASASVINQNAEDVRNDVDQIAEKTDEISKFAKSMREHASAMEAAARENMQQTDEKVKDILAVLNQAIAESKSVDEVNSLTQDILSISSQTNLLALNASIEAARAGDAGKGFAVVAQEITKLAESSRETANRIQVINKGVTKAVHNLAGHANNLVSYLGESILPEFESFVNVGDEYKENATYIEAVMEEFNTRTEELQTTVSEIASSIHTITTAIDDSATGINGAAKNTQKLVVDMEAISRRMDENIVIKEELKKETAIFKKL